MRKVFSTVLFVAVFTVTHASGAEPTSTSDGTREPEIYSVQKLNPRQQVGEWIADAYGKAVRDAAITSAVDGVIVTAFLTRDTEGSFILNVASDSATSNTIDVRSAVFAPATALPNNVRLELLGLRGSLAIHTLATTVAPTPGQIAGCSGNKCNCVLFARCLVPKLPFSLTYYTDKLKIINAYTPVPGAVAIIQVSASELYGHVAVVMSVNNGVVTIVEANWKTCTVGYRSGTPSMLHIQGYFVPK